MDHYEAILKNLVVPVLTLVGYMVDRLPSIAAAASVAWIVWQWYHSPPMQERRAQKRAKRRAFKMRSKRETD